MRGDIIAISLAMISPSSLPLPVPAAATMPLLPAPAAADTRLPASATGAMLLPASAALLLLLLLSASPAPGTCPLDGQASAPAWAHPLLVLVLVLGSWVPLAGALPSLLLPAAAC